MRSLEMLADEATDVLDPQTHEEWERLRSTILLALYAERGTAA